MFNYSPTVHNQGALRTTALCVEKSICEQLTRSTASRKCSFIERKSSSKLSNTMKVKFVSNSYYFRYLDTSRGII